MSKKEDTDFLEQKEEEAAEIADVMGEEKVKILKAFFENEKLAQIFKEAFLGRVLQQTTLDELTKNTGNNWIIGVAKNGLDPEEFGKYVIQEAEILRRIATGWDDLERISKKKTGAKRSPLNEAK